MTSVGLYYVPYKLGAHIKTEADRKKQLHRFIYDFPETEYVYIIRIINHRTIFISIYFLALESTTSFSKAAKSSKDMAPKSPSAR